MIGLRNAEFLEEHVAHLSVVVLTGVHDAIAQHVAPTVQGPHHRRELHEVRPRAGHEIEHASGHRQLTISSCAAAFFVSSSISDLV